MAPQKSAKGCDTVQSPLSPPAPPSNLDLKVEREFVAAALRHEAASVAALADGIGAGFHKAVDLLVDCAQTGGTVLITGMGKSGLVGAKMSATMASLGIPAHSVHPSEAAHGDLGKFRKQDVVIAISASGETEEVVALVDILRQDGIRVISITARDADSQGTSSLSRAASVFLNLGIGKESGEPEFLAPTASTTATMALGDALAIATARRQNFTHEDFRRRHPGGALGSQLRPVTDVLRFVAGKNLPLIRDNLTVAQALMQAESVGRRPGALVLVNEQGELSGIFTDGDLRRLVLKGTGTDVLISVVMTRSPRTLRDDALVRDAVHLVREFRSDEFPVVDAQNRPVGVLDVQDLMTLKLVQED